MHRLDVFERRHAVSFAPDQKFVDAEGVGSPRMNVPYIGSEELNKARAHRFVGSRNKAG